MKLIIVFGHPSTDNSQLDLDKSRICSCAESLTTNLQTRSLRVIGPQSYATWERKQNYNLYDLVRPWSLM